MDRVSPLAFAALLLAAALPAQSPLPSSSPASGDAAQQGAPPAGELVEGIACRSDPSQTYTLYLPTAYTPERRWPVLLIFDPRGRAKRAAEIFRDVAEEHGWILVSSHDTRSDGPWEPNLKALAALVPEVEERWPSDRRRIYAAGFSGGHTVALLLGKQTDVLAGVIGVGGPLVPQLLGEEIRYAHFGAAGIWDFNFFEQRRLDAELAHRGAVHRLEHFPGPHRWFPPELARQAVEWMEIQAMKQGLRPVDEELARHLFAADLEAARELEAAGEALAALRRYRAVADTYGGLAALAGPLAEVEEEAARLEGSAAVKTAEREERRWELEEGEANRRLSQAVAQLRTAPVSELRPSRMVSDLRIPSLRERAREETSDGHAARRILESLFTHTSFYLPRDFLAERSYGRAAAALSIAVEIHDDRPGVWYNLACAEAQSGRRKKALEALSRAVDAGFRDLEHMQADPDLETLRATEGYQEIVERLGGANSRGSQGSSPRSSLEAHRHR